MTARDEYPRQFGPYILLKPLARGGMGALYLAVHGERGMEKLCVVKTALPHLLGKGYGQRFRDEASVVVRLSHGNLVNVFDAGQVAGEIYIAMDFCEGKDLRAVWNRCAQKGIAFPVDIAVHIAKELARGLGYVHAFKGLRLVHRDISPPNVLVSYTGEVKITDFGLAWSTVKVEKTVPGIIFGKVSYMAPEQARGETVDGRADLYAVGIILWELLTGRQLFPSAAGGGNDEEVLERVRHPQIAPPSERAPRVSKELDAVVMKALAADPALRHQAGEELRAELAAFQARTAPATDGDQVARFLRKLFGDAMTEERAERDHLVNEAASLLEPPTTPKIRTVGRPGEETSTPTTSQVAAGTAERDHTATITAGGESDAPSRLVGTLLAGRYRIKRLCGEGGMGRVYEAEHVEIGKRVAVKVLHPAYSRMPEVVERFRREARAASRIGHPNIVDVTDSGNTDDGAFFFVMEFIEGMELGLAIFREGPLPVRRALHISAQMCDALQAAHDAGVIHRDLKPENVLLITKEGQADFVKVLDFGIAKSAEVEETTRAGRRLTRPGVAMGTPEYMAPEQAAGKPADPRSDIYAVGSIMYEMLTGTPPYEGENVMEVLHKKANEAPARIRKLEAGVPEAVEELVERAMARSPAARPQSMGALATEVRALMASLEADAAGAAQSGGELRRESPVMTGALEPAAGAAMLAGFSRRVVALGAGALLLLGGVVFISAAPWRRGAPTPHVTRAPIASPPTPVALEPPAASPAESAPAAGVGPTLPVEAATAAEESPAEGPKATAHAEDESRRRAPRAGRRGLSSSDRRRLLEEGWKLYQAQRFDDARATFSKLVATKAPPGGAFLGLAKVAFQEHNYAEAAKRAQQGVRSGAGVEAHMLLGDAYYRLRRFDQARKAYKDALVLEPGNETAAKNLKLSERQIP